LLPALRSTLTVLASQMGGTYRFALGKHWLCFDQSSSVIARPKCVEALARFSLSPFRVLPAALAGLPFFNQMIEQDLSPTPFAPIGKQSNLRFH
jgi:hypothetical protein